MKTVDVVLNCLSGNYIQYSLDLLSSHGRFVEIGKRGIWTLEAVKAHRPDIESYHIVALDDKRKENPLWWLQYFEQMMDEFNQVSAVTYLFI